MSGNEIARLRANRDGIFTDLMEADDTRETLALADKFVDAERAILTQLRADNAAREAECMSAISRAAKTRDGIKRRIAEATPVDRATVTLTDGAPVPEDRSHTALKPNGQQEGYIVLSDAERAKGFVRPVRDSYRHVGKRPKYPTRDLTADQVQRFGDGKYALFEVYPEGDGPTGRYWTHGDLNSGCGTVTTMSRSLSETYARKPDFYSGTFCCTCHTHFDVGEHGEFVWIESDGKDGSRVGT